MPDQVVGTINPAVENLSPGDLEIVREGQAQMDALDVQKATINNFVLNHIVKKYKLQQGDNLDVQAGTITRKKVDTNVSPTPSPTPEVATLAKQEPNP